MMNTHAEIIVIGGGVVGCSVLYHLAKLGKTDTVLLERATLTSGSSWHAAGGFHTLNADPNVSKLQEYTIELYKELEKESEISCGLHVTGEACFSLTMMTAWISCENDGCQRALSWD